MKKLIEGMQLLIKNNKLTQNESTDLLAGIEKGSLTVEVVFETINSILEENKI